MRTIVLLSAAAVLTFCDRSTIVIVLTALIFFWAMRIDEPTQRGIGDDMDIDW
jgi:hypothetical protein